MDVILNQILKPPKLKNIKKAICIQPHPDDNEVGMGGVIKKLINDGCEIQYITVTDGSLGLVDDTHTHSELATRRKQEAIESGTYLGVSKFHFLEYQDGTLSNINEISGKISEIVRKEQPDFIFAPDPWLLYEAHQDHVVTGKASAQCFINSWLYEYPLGTKTKPHKCKGIGFYFTSKPNKVVDITNTFDDKMKALSFHNSQFDKKTLSLFKLYFKQLSKKAAANEKFKLGTGLKIMGEHHLHCYIDAENV